MELQVFENSEFGKVRTVMIEGVPWLVGRDVAKALGYLKPENAIAVHVDHEDKTTTLIQGSGSNYKSKTLVINESGVYALIFKSQLPTAKSFKRWVTSQVLPAIRQTGAYLTPKLKLELETYKAKAEYLDFMLGQEALTNIRITAKLLRIPERLFTQILEDVNFAYRIKKGDQLIPTSTAMKQDYATLVPVVVKDQYSGVQMKITPLGRLWIFCRVKKQFALPYTMDDCLSVDKIRLLQEENK